MRALVIACLSMTWTGCGPAVAPAASHSGGSAPRPLTARADTSEFPDDPVGETESGPTGEPPLRAGEAGEPDSIEQFLDPQLLPDAEVREREAGQMAEPAPLDAVQDDPRRVMRDRTATSTSERAALRDAVMEHVAGRTWLCTEAARASVLVRIERRAPRRASEQAVLDAGWTLLHARMFYGETELLPGVEERFVQTLDADSIMRVDENGARVVFADWGAFYIREVTTRSFTLVGAVSTRGLVAGTRSCAPAPARRGRR